MGLYDLKNSKCLAGCLATWARRYLKYFNLKNDLNKALAAKLQSSNKFDQDYIFAFFFNDIFKLNDKPSVYTRLAIKRGLNKGDIRFYNSVKWLMESDDYQDWKDDLKPTYDSFKEIEPQLENPEDDIPF